MSRRLISNTGARSWFLLYFLCSSFSIFAQTPVVTPTNLTIRVMAANLTSGSNQRYETPGLNILKGLRPDVVALQEFNFASTNGQGINSPAALREMVDNTFGTNFAYFRETSGYAIPNGIVSRWPILGNGSWEDVDPGVNDRGFAWARIDLPGTNDLYVVSIHLKASSGSNNPDRRYAEATSLVNLVQTQFPADAWIMVAGDCNIYDPSEPAYQHLASAFSDAPIPTDAQTGGSPNTNAGRSERYDYVFLSKTLADRVVPLVLPSRIFTNGLVFDSRTYAPLSDMTPVRAGDSGATGMQHMAVLKDLQISHFVTNYIPELAATFGAPQLQNGQLRVSVTGAPGYSYAIQCSSNLVDWVPVQTNSSPFVFLDMQVGNSAQRFYRAMAIR